MRFITRGPSLPTALTLALFVTGCSATAPAVRVHAGAPLPRSTAARAESSPKGSVSLVVGNRSVDDWDSEPTGFGDTVDLGDHDLFGIEFASISESGLGFETSLLYSSGEDSTVAMGIPIDLELSMLEVAFGARYTVTELGIFHPYLGAGFELIAADLGAFSGGVQVNADETDYGFYAHVGASVLLGYFSIGIDLRTLTGTDNDLDYTQVAATVGVGF